MRLSASAAYVSRSVSRSCENIQSCSWTRHDDAARHHRIERRPGASVLIRHLPAAAAAGGGAVCVSAAAAGTGQTASITHLFRARSGITDRSLRYTSLCSPCNRAVDDVTAAARTSAIRRRLTTRISVTSQRLRRPI